MKTTFLLWPTFLPHTTSYLAIVLFDCNSFGVCVCVSVLACFALEVYMLNCNNTWLVSNSKTYGFI